MIRKWIRKSPRLRSLLLRGYHGALEVTERHLLGTKFQEIRWRLRRIDGTQTVDLAHPHRSFLVGRVGRFAPFESILEVGCNDYVELLHGVPGVKAVQVEKLPPGLWTDSNWNAYGALVEVQV